MTFCLFLTKEKPIRSSLIIFQLALLLDLLSFFCCYFHLCTIVVDVLNFYLSFLCSLFSVFYSHFEILSLLFYNAGRCGFLLTLIMVMIYGLKNMIRGWVKPNKIKYRTQPMRCFGQQTWPFSLFFFPSQSL